MLRAEVAVTYDILLGDNLDIPFSTQHVTGVDIVAQRVHFRLGTIKGEWLLDKNVGLDFATWLSTKMTRTRAAEIGEIIRREVLETPGVLRVDNFVAELTGRTLNISGDVLTSDGTFAFEVNPFAPVAGSNASPFFLYQLNSRGPIAAL